MAAPNSTLRRPTFIKVDQLRPGTAGHTLSVKVVSSKLVLQKARPDGTASLVRIAAASTSPCVAVDGSLRRSGAVSDGLGLRQECRRMSSHVSWDYRGQRQLVPLGGRVPSVAVDAYVAPNVVLVGSVDVQDRASVWYGCVLRGDLNRITIGFCSNVGDKCVLHAATSSPTGLSAETNIGKIVTVGSFSTLRSCTIEDEVVIGQRCVIMEGSLVETHSILESGSVIPPGRRIPAGEVWAGNPARFVRKVSYDEIAMIPRLAEEINEIAQSHMDEFLPYSTAYLQVEKLIKSNALVK